MTFSDLLQHNIYAVDAVIEDLPVAAVGDCQRQLLIHPTKTSQTSRRETT